MVMKSVSKPHGVFQGYNFMTPDVLSYYKLRRSLGYAELSMGFGLSNERIYGVTVKPNGDLSKLFFSLVAAQDYIESLS